MFFKLELSVQNLQLKDGQATEFAIGGSHSVKVVLRIPSAEEQNKGFKLSSTICVITSQQKPNKGVNQVFERLANEMDNQAAAEVESDSEIHQFNQDGRLKMNAGSLRSLPQHFQSFYKQVFDELNETGRKAVNIIRWACGLKGKHNPFGEKSFQWSFDGSLWREMPRYYTLYMELPPPPVDLNSTTERSNLFVDLINRLQDEPLGHSLFPRGMGAEAAEPKKVPSLWV